MRCLGIGDRSAPSRGTVNSRNDQSNATALVAAMEVLLCPGTDAGACAPHFPVPGGPRLLRASAAGVLVRGGLRGDEPLGGDGPFPKTTPIMFLCGRIVRLSSRTKSSCASHIIGSV